VSRLAHPHDARSALIAPTEAGHAELAAARARNADVVDDLLARQDVDAETLQDVIAVLRGLTEQ
jgi:DNA-binding MarR family transcriptional regulator